MAGPVIVVEGILLALLFGSNVLVWSDNNMVLNSIFSSKMGEKENIDSTLMEF